MPEHPAPNPAPFLAAVGDDGRNETRRAPSASTDVSERADVDDASEIRGGEDDPDRDASAQFLRDRVDGGQMQRRRRGLSEQGASLSDGSVVPFPPSGDRTRVRSEQVGVNGWVGDSEDAPVSSSRRPAGPASPRHPATATVTETKAASTSRGRNSIGVLMPGLAVARDLSGARPEDIGVLTHAVVAIVAPHLPTLTGSDLPERILDVTGSLINFNRTTKARPLMLTAAGHASIYLRRLAPTPPWMLLGAEFRLTGANTGRVDLAWQHQDTGQVLFDEIKTTNRAISMINNTWFGQTKKYAAAGAQTYGDAFLGVRLLPLGSLHLSLLIGPDGTRRPIAPTPTTPLAGPGTEERS